MCHAWTSHLRVMRVLLTYVLCMDFSPVCYACTSHLCVIHVFLTYMLCMYFLPVCYTCTSCLCVLHVLLTKLLPFMIVCAHEKDAQILTPQYTFYWAALEWHIPHKSSCSYIGKELLFYKN